MPREPDYIYYGGAALPAPPFSCNQARFMSLPCAGDRVAIQNFVDRTLNAATSPARYGILSHYVFLAIMAADSAGSTTPPFSTHGTMAETDIGFWIPVTDAQTPDAIFWYPAYLFVDNWMAVVGGREIWGFPKALATIDVAPGDPRDGAIIVSTLAMQTLAPGSRAGMAEIFRLTPGAAAAPARCLAEGESLVAAMAELLADEMFLDLVALMTRLFRSSRFADQGSPMIFLKQVRDVSSVTGAGYRSVITANATLTALLAPPSFKGEHSLTLNDFASQPIAGDLGIPLGEQTLPFAICADLNFTMGLGVPVATG